MKNKIFYTYEVGEDEILITQTNEETPDSFDHPEDIKKQLRSEGYTQPFVQNTPIQHWLNSYGVFCMAMSLPERNEQELDLLWERACGLYGQFLESPLNNPNKSELDCIHEFLRNQ